MARRRSEAPPPEPEDDGSPTRRGCSIAAVAILLLIVWIAVILISNFSGFRDTVQDQLHKQTGMTFLLEKASLDLQWDLVLKEAEWSDDESPMRRATAKRVVLRWKFFRSLVEKKFVIDSVEIEGLDANLHLPMDEYFSMPEPKDIAGFLVDLGRPYGFFQDPVRRNLYMADSKWSWQDPPAAGSPDNVYYLWEELDINIAPIRIPNGVLRDHVMVRAAIHRAGEGQRIPMQREFLVLPGLDDRPPSLVMVDE